MYTFFFYLSTWGAVKNIKDAMLEVKQIIYQWDNTPFIFRANQMNHLCLTACHISVIKKKGVYVRVCGVVEAGWVYSQSLWRSPWESSETSLYSQGTLWQLWYIYLLTRTEIISFHLHSCLTEDQWDTSLSFWSTVTWRCTAGPLHWAYLISWISLSTLAILSMHHV